MLDLALRAQGKWPGDMVQRLEGMQAGLETLALSAMQELDGGAADLRSAQRAAAGPRLPSYPPMTNRGVTATRKPPQKPRK